MAEITVELVTPECIAFAEQAHMVVAPGILGEFGALAGHAPFISQLKPGVIQLYSDDSTVNRSFIVTEGFAEVHDRKCIILCEKAYDVEAFDKAAVEADLESARHGAKYGETEAEREIQSGKVASLTEVLKLYSAQ